MTSHIYEVSTEPSRFSCVPLHRCSVRSTETISLFAMMKFTDHETLWSAILSLSFPSYILSEACCQLTTKPYCNLAFAMAFIIEPRGSKKLLSIWTLSPWRLFPYPHRRFFRLLFFQYLSQHIPNSLTIIDLNVFFQHEDSSQSRDPHSFPVTGFCGFLNCKLC
jgi:hypothetical protein